MIVVFEWRIIFHQIPCVSCLMVFVVVFDGFVALMVVWFGYLFVHMFIVHSYVPNILGVAAMESV